MLSILPATINHMQHFRYISLFSGGYGLDLGLEQARTDTFDFEIRACIDNALAARETIRFNRPDIRVLGSADDEFGGDITQLSTTTILQRAALAVGEADFVVGGPPCQSWSVLGNRQGFDDPRGDLMRQFARVVREVQPRAFLMENVAGFRTHADGTALEIMLVLFRAAGYPSLFVWTLNAADFGVPQFRQRVFIVGYRADIPIPRGFDQPVSTHRNPASATLPATMPIYQTVRDAFRNLADNAPNHIVRVHGEVVRARYALLAEGARDPVDHTDRLRWDKPSCTVLVGSSTGGGRPAIHPSEPRHLTVREAARLQGFPDDWIFKNKPTPQYRLVGNAVPPALACAVGRQIVEPLLHIHHIAHQQDVPPGVATGIMGFFRSCRGHH